MTKPNLIEAFLQEQQDLKTAVVDFSEVHDAGVPSQAKYYQKLIPLDKPGDGEQYAFEVDLDKCSGCKGCVTACHNLNGLDEEETWRDVGTIHGGTWENPFAQTITSACHHCVNPGCMDGCPVLAYDKDPVTGIVKHLDDQCIGCQYCTFKCPFDVPKYNPSLGIVRKCDMCSSRLAVGEAPACVQSCPTEAISIRIVKQDEMVERAEEGQFLIGAPDPSYTKPTTTYKTERKLPENAKAADFYSVQPEHAHVPLLVMTILTQVSVGIFCWDILYSLLYGEIAETLISRKSVAAALLGVVALSAAIFHLGRPLYAFRAIIGLKTSWMSREILAFSIFAKTAIAYAGVLWVPTLAEKFGLHFIPMDLIEKSVLPLALGTALSGLGGVFCSAMIYVDTRRHFWNFSRSMAKFFGTTVVAGLSGMMLLSHGVSYILPESKLLEIHTGSLTWVLFTLPIVALLKMIFEYKDLFYLDKEKDTTWNKYLYRSALLMSGTLKRPSIVRGVLTLIGAVALPLFIYILQTGGSANYNEIALLFFSSLSFLLVLAGEFMERYLYFTAVVAPKMPGGFK